MQHHRAGCGVAHGQSDSATDRGQALFLSDAGACPYSTLVLLLILLSRFLRHHSPIHAELAVDGLLVAVFLGQGFGQQPLASVDPLPRTLQMVLVGHCLDRSIPLLTLHPVVCAIVSNFDDFVSHYLIAKVPRACVLLRAALVPRWDGPNEPAPPTPAPFPGWACHRRIAYAVSLPFGGSGAERA